MSSSAASSKPGERIDWENGVFFLDVETGRTEAYRAEEAFYNNHRHSEDGAWVYTWLGRDRTVAVLRRETGQAWRWPPDSLRLVAMSQGHILLEERERSKESSILFGALVLVNHEMEEVGRFSIGTVDDQYKDPIVLFSPDGQIIVFSVRNTVYHASVASFDPIVVFQSEKRDGWEISTSPDPPTDWLVGYPDLPDERGFLVRSWYRILTDSGDTDTDLETHYFNWEGTPVPNFAPGFYLPMEDTWHSSRESMTTRNMLDFFLRNDHGLPLYSPMPEPANRYFACIPLTCMMYSGMDSGCPTVKDLLLRSKIKQKMRELHMRLFTFNLNLRLSI